MASNKTKGFASGAATGAASGSMILPGWGTLIGGVLGGISGLMSGGAADDAQKMAEMQVKYSKLETAENLRRMRLEAEQVLGYAEASVFASDLLLTGSSKSYIGAMESEFISQQAWLKESARIQQRMFEKGGSAASGSIMSSMYAQQLTQLGTSAASYFGGGFGDPTLSPNASGAMQSTTGPSLTPNVYSKHIRPSSTYVTMSSVVGT